MWVDSSAFWQRDMLTNITLRTANQKSSGQGNRKLTARHFRHCILTASNITMWPY